MSCNVSFRGHVAYHRYMAIIESDIDAVEVRNGKLQFAALFHALADPTRRAILADALSQASALGLSAHLSCLKDTGLVRVRSQGRASIYSLGQQEALDALAAAASALLPQDAAHHQWHEAHGTDRRED